MGVCALAQRALKSASQYLRVELAVRQLQMLLQPFQTEASRQSFLLLEGTGGVKSRAKGAEGTSRMCRPLHLQVLAGLSPLTNKECGLLDWCVKSHDSNRLDIYVHVSKEY